MDEIDNVVRSISWCEFAHTLLLGAVGVVGGVVASGSGGGGVSSGMLVVAVVVDLKGKKGKRREGEDGEWVLEDSSEIEEKKEKILRQCRENLPPFMVPSLLLFLSSPPLTPNGKVDKRKIQRICADHRDWLAGSSSSSPSSSSSSFGLSEEDKNTIENIWNLVLGFQPQQQQHLHQAGFFEQGGTSLTLIRMSSEVSSKFPGFSFDISKFRKEGGRFGELCAQVGRWREGRKGDKVKREEETLEERVKEREEEEEGVVSLPSSFSIAPPQKGLWILYQTNQKSKSKTTTFSEYNVPVIISLSKKGWEGELVREVVKVLCKQHPGLLSRFPSPSSSPTSSLFSKMRVRLEENESLFFDFEEVVCRGGVGGDSGDIENEFIHRNFDISNGPLFRVMIVKEEKREGEGGRVRKVLFVFHHLVVDEWSLRIFLKDFFKLYEFAEQQEQISSSLFSSLRLPSPKNYYQFWQQQQQQQQQHQQHLQFWKKEISSLPSFEPLKDILPSPLSPSPLPTSPPTASHLSFSIPSLLPSSLTSLSSLYSTSPFSLLFSLFSLGVGKYFDLSDFVVLVPCANRENGSEDVVGLFTSTIPIRVKVKKGLYSSSTAFLSNDFVLTPFSSSFLSRYASFLLNQRNHSNN